MWESADGTTPIGMRFPGSLSSPSQAIRIPARHFSLRVRRPDLLKVQFGCRELGLQGERHRCRGAMLQEGARPWFLILRADGKDSNFSKQGRFALTRSTRIMGPW